jgi:hypothetical protein
VVRVEGWRKIVELGVVEKVDEGGRSTLAYPV